MWSWSSADARAHLEINTGDMVRSGERMQSKVRQPPTGSPAVGSSSVVNAICPYAGCTAVGTEDGIGADLVGKVNVRDPPKPERAKPSGIGRITVQVIVGTHERSVGIRFTSQAGRFRSSPSSVAKVTNLGGAHLPCQLSKRIAELPNKVSCLPANWARR